MQEVSVPVSEAREKKQKTNNKKNIFGIKQYKSSCYSQNDDQSSANLMFCCQVRYLPKDALLNMKFIPNLRTLMSPSIYGD